MITRRLESIELSSDRVRGRSIFRVLSVGFGFTHVVLSCCLVLACMDRDRIISSIESTPHKLYVACVTYSN